MEGDDVDGIYAFVDSGYLRATAEELSPDYPWLEPFGLINACFPGKPRYHDPILGTIDRLSYYDAVNEDADDETAKSVRALSRTACKALTFLIRRTGD